MPLRFISNLSLARIVPIGLALLLSVGIAQAHVRIFPAQSMAGKEEVYTLVVPTEGTSATVAVELSVPPGVKVVSVNAPAAEYTVLKEGDRITRITWRVNIAPGGSRELVFTAQNPREGGPSLPWNVHQLFADGSRADWIDPPPSRPAPLTRLLAN